MFGERNGMKNGRKVFIPECNCFGTEYDILLTCDNWPRFLEVWDNETLDTLLSCAIGNENYEIAEIINQIKQKR